MAGFGFDDEGTTYGLHDLDIDWTGGSRHDYERTGGGKAFEKRDLYDQSLEGKLMMEVRKDLGTYNFSGVKTNRIEEAIRRHDMDLKQSFAPLIVAATIFLDIYESRGGLNAKNFAAFEKHRRKNIKKLDLIRYIRFLNTLGVEVNK
jgi:hypothetical protein